MPPTGASSRAGRRRGPRRAKCSTGCGTSRSYRRDYVRAGAVAGLPAVVGVDRATRLVRDGRRIRVHGADGYVELLS